MDTYSVVYSPAARDDLFGVYTYIATELLEPEIAAKQTVRIRNAIRKLEQLPARHASVNWEPWFSMGMRKLIVDHYTVFYLVHEPTCEVRIVRIVYSGRDLKSILNDSLDLYHAHFSFSISLTAMDKEILQMVKAVLYHVFL